jgi:hypothetical protein
LPVVASSAGGFSGGMTWGNGAHYLQVPWAFLGWSAISVGRAELMHLVRYGRAALIRGWSRLALTAPSRSLTRA